MQDLWQKWDNLSTTTSVSQGQGAKQDWFMHDPDATKIDRGLGPWVKLHPQHNPMKIKSQCYHALLQQKYRTHFVCSNAATVMTDTQVFEWPNYLTILQAEHFAFAVRKSTASQNNMHSISYYWHDNVLETGSCLWPIASSSDRGVCALQRGATVTPAIAMWAGLLPAVNSTNRHWLGKPTPKVKQCYFKYGTTLTDLSKAISKVSQTTVTVL